MPRKILAVISANKDVLKRKLVVTVGTGVGILVASALVDRLSKTGPDILVLETDTSTDTPVKQ